MTLVVSRSLQTADHTLPAHILAKFFDPIIPLVSRFADSPTHIVRGTCQKRGKEESREKHKFLTIFLYSFASTNVRSFYKGASSLASGNSSLRVDSRKKKKEYRDAYILHIPRIYIFWLATTNFRVYFRRDSSVKKIPPVVRKHTRSS